VLQALGNSPTADKLQMEKIEALLTEIEDG
jgi:hypothetical protein